jgi:hypothetical protein
LSDMLEFLWKKREILSWLWKWKGSSQPNHHTPLPHPPTPSPSPGWTSTYASCKTPYFFSGPRTEASGTLFFPLLTTFSFFDHATSQDTRLSVHSLGLHLCSFERIEASIELNQCQLWWSLNPNTISNQKPWMENIIYLFFWFLVTYDHRQTDRQTDRLHRYIIHSYIHRWSIFNPPNLNVLCWII